MSRLRQDRLGAGDPISLLVTMMYFGIAFMVMSVIGVLSGKFMLMMGFLVIIFIVMLLMLVVIRQPAGKKWIIVASSIAIVMILGAILLGWFGNFALAPPGFDSRTHWWHGEGQPLGLDQSYGYINVEGWFGQLHAQARGGFTDNGREEILDSTGYAASSRIGGEGDTVLAIAAACQRTSGIMNTDYDAFHDTEYRFYFTSNMEWGDPVLVVKGGTPKMTWCEGHTNLDLAQFKTGSGNGWLKVQVWWKMIDDKSYIVAEDMAEIRDGTGKITEPEEQHVAEIGKPVSIVFRVGWGCSRSTSDLATSKTAAEGGGWAAAIYSEGRDWAKVDEWNLGCGSDGMTPMYISKTYTPTTDDFNTVGCKIRLRVELYNNLFLKDTIDTFTLDLSKVFKLSLPKLTVSSTDVAAGDTVTASVNGTGDKIFWVVKYIDGTGGDILRENSSASSITFVPPRKGDIEVTVSCMATSDCSVSDPVHQKIHVRGTGEPPPPAWFGWLYPILVVILIIITVVLVLYFVKPMWLKLLVAFLLTLIILAAAWWLGVFGV